MSFDERRGFRRSLCLWSSVRTQLHNTVTRTEPQFSKAVKQLVSPILFKMSGKFMQDFFLLNCVGATAEADERETRKASEHILKKCHIRRSFWKNVWHVCGQACVSACVRAGHACCDCGPCLSHTWRGQTLWNLDVQVGKSI